MEVGGEGDYIPIATLSPPEWLLWAAMKAILMFHNCEGQSHKTVSTDYNFRRERRAEAGSNRGPSAYQPNAWPLGQTGSRVLINEWTFIYGKRKLSLLTKAMHVHSAMGCNYDGMFKGKFPLTGQCSIYTLSIAFWYLPLNSARIGYATWRGTLYLRTAVHRRGQRPPKGSGTNMIVEAT